MPATVLLESGDDSTINAALSHVGAHGIVKLAPRSTFVLHQPVRFTAPHQELSTAGYPAHSALDGGPDELASLVCAVPNGSTAVNGENAEGCRIRCLRIEGGREEYGWVQGSGATVLIGGSASDQLVDGCHIFSPRGWSCLQVFEGPPHARSQRATVTNNLIGPAGYPETLDPQTGDKLCRWADGISLAGCNAVVTGNNIVDATDGGIVIFGAPGSLVAGNTVICRTRSQLGAINLVDMGPYAGDYTGMRVLSNTILAPGPAFLRVGISIGPAVWGDDRQSFIRGATVSHNTISGHMAFGLAIAGARDVVVRGNVVLPSSLFGGEMRAHDPREGVVQPAPFVKCRDGEMCAGEIEGDLFVEGNIRYLIGCRPPGEPPAPPPVPPRPGDPAALIPADWRITPPFDWRITPSSPPSTPLCLSPRGQLQLLSPSGEVVWTSPNAPGEEAQDWTAVLQLDGNLVIYSKSGPVWATATNGRGQGREVIGMRVEGTKLLLIDETGAVAWSSS